jgi:isopentenyldiphosphate isomerase
MADNPNEIFDVVDASDRVIGQKPRGIVHSEGLLHRAVHVLIVNEEGTVFLQKRSMGKDSAPGKWDSSASGHLDAGEGYAEAAIREVEEELGCAGVVLEEIGRLEASETTGWEFVRIYKGNHEGPFTLHPDEIETGRWVSVEALGKWLEECPGDFARCFIEVWKTATQSKGFTSRGGAR